MSPVCYIYTSPSFYSFLSQAIMSLTPSICHSTSTYTHHAVLPGDSSIHSLLSTWLFDQFSFTSTKILRLWLAHGTDDHLWFGEWRKHCYNWVIKVKSHAPHIWTDSGEKVKKHISFVALKLHSAFTSCSTVSLKSYFLPRWHASIWLYRCEGRICEESITTVPQRR